MSCIAYLKIKIKLKSYNHNNLLKAYHGVKK